ncbi:MAG: hypothetical protein WCE45_00305 [Sedimentisphaerales bacterium]
MTSVVVRVPLLTLDNAINFSNELFQLPDSEEYVFDFSNMDWVEPFGMLYLSSQISKFRQSKSLSTFYAINHEHFDYAGHMGFFKTFGLNFGKQQGEAKGSLNYIPITSVKVDSLKNGANQNWEHIGETIERRSHRLACVLTRLPSGNLVDTLKYSFCEIIRNVVEHSSSGHINYCAQYWPSQNLVEVSILDTGIGIRRSLSENPFLKDIVSDKEAIHNSLLPGISGKMYKGKKVQPNDYWQNAGFGLYMTSRLCRNSGSFFICSGDAGILLVGKTKKLYKTNFSGTVLRLALNIQGIDSLSKTLAKFSREGQELAKTLKGVGRIPASAASLMLTEDFKKPSNDYFKNESESYEDLPF